MMTENNNILIEKKNKKFEKKILYKLNEIKRVRETKRERLKLIEWVNKKKPGYTNILNLKKKKKRELKAIIFSSVSF
jgi:hypothetical protein